MIEQEILSNKNHFEYLKFEVKDGVYAVTLNDLSGHDIVRGYGNTIIEALNDMHRGII